VHPDAEVFDVAFVGMGAGAGVLVCELERAGWLAGKRIAVIEPEGKGVDDKTYCFWAAAEDEVMQRWGEQVANVWPKVSIDRAVPQPIAPQAYRRIRSIDVYRRAFAVLEQAGARRFTASLQTPSAPAGHGAEAPFALELDGGERLHAYRVFDSRPPRFEGQGPTDVRLVQSFVGWRVRLLAPTAVWDAETVTMMDFHVPQGPAGEVQFMYVLPEGPAHGLVELTRFGAAVLGPEEAEGVLRAYLHERLGPFEVLESEVGQIPMCHAPAAHARLPVHPRWTALGARAGAVKPSTGYAFKAMVAHAGRVRAALEAGTQALAPARAPRFVFYDHLLLLILRDEPALGKPIFQRLFRVRPTAFVLDFLDERTAVWQEAAMFARLPVGPFLRAWGKRMRGPAWVWVAAVVCCHLLLRWAPPEAAQVGLAVLFGAGLVAVGIPHGALDAATAIGREGLSPGRFYTQYLGAMALCGLGWWLVPDAALVAFLLLSAWHFGQTDVLLARGGSPAPAASWAWGSLLLAFLLGLHLPEAAAVLAPLGIHPPALTFLTTHAALLAAVLTALLAATALAALLTRRFYALPALFALALTAGLPLLVAFGTYFIFHHSISGWAHLRRGTGWSSRTLWLRGAPFTAGAFLFLAASIFALTRSTGNPDLAVGTFFAALSALSIPHILASHRFLKLGPAAERPAR